MDNPLDSSKTATAPQGTATAPQGTATAPQGTATAPQGTATAPTMDAAYSGTQADIMVQNDKILKVYKAGYNFNTAVLPLVKRMKGQGVVVDLYDYGTMSYEGEQRSFELMEYCPEGAVSAVDLKGDKDTILKIIQKTAKALNACHRAGFIHKDVKPANILIRDRSTWDCVLCDFGIADVLDHGKVTTQQSRTPIYAAPEVYEHTVTIDNRTYCELTPAADFYSLGMTILCLWYGESVFLSKETTLAMQKVHNGIIVPADMPEPLYTITRGLLVKDPAHRWGLKEITDTLNGKKVDVYDEQRQGGLNIVFNSGKQQIAHSLEELAAFMVDDMDLGIKYLYSGKVSKWLEPFPELQIEIDNITEKEFPKDKEMGALATIHTLNPFYDLRLCCDLKDPNYAMTGASIGQLLNRVYDHYFTQKNADDLDKRIAESFSLSGDRDYVAWFFDHKGDRFTKQRKWFGYCVTNDIQNNKKAGPKDSKYLQQVTMMKTLTGFGAEPEYRLSRTGEVLKDIDDLHKVPKKELLYDLKHDRGIRGWLAVMCHENPYTDLSKKFTYEKELEKYINWLGYIDPNEATFTRFSQAKKEARDLASTPVNQSKGTRNASIIQRLIAIFLGFIPLLLLLIDLIIIIAGKATIRMPDWIEYISIGIGLLVGLFAFHKADGSLLAGGIAGVIAGVASFYLIRWFITIFIYFYGLNVLAALVYFSIITIFNFKRQRTKTKAIAKPGFEELTLEPLYYAFSDEDCFDSSLNAYIDPTSHSLRKKEVRQQWIKVAIFVGCSLLLNLLRYALPEIKH